MNLNPITEFVRKLPFNQDVLWSIIFIILLWSFGIWITNPPFVGQVFLLALSTILVLIGRHFFVNHQKKKEEENSRKEVLKELNRLSKGENEILNNMILKRANTHFASISCQYTNALVGKRILEKSFNELEYIHPTQNNPYKMPDFVWEKLNNNLNSSK